MNGIKILIIEDDTELSLLVKEALESEGYSSDSCADGAEALEYLLSNAYDLAILDRMLPSIDGASLIRNARQKGIATPVLMATALGRVDDRIDGLDAGADDYIVKPFDIRELLARVRALTRRPVVMRQSDLQYADLTLFPDELKLVGKKGECILSKREAELLSVFLQNAENVLTRDYLYNRIWGIDGEVESATLDIYLHFVRRHLAAASGRVIITTIRKVGYKLEKKGNG